MRPLKSEIVSRWTDVDLSTVEIPSDVECLSLTSLRPFDPEALPKLSDFPKLARVEIAMPDLDKHRDAWISYAVAHPELDFAFGRLIPSDKRITVTEIYRGLDVLRIEEDKKTTFEISGDLAVDGGTADNSELEERLRKIAQRNKKKIQWSSELDTFVAKTSDLDTARWVIDRILDQGAAEQSRLSGKSAAGQRSKKLKG